MGDGGTRWEGQDGGSDDDLLRQLAGGWKDGEAWREWGVVEDVLDNVMMDVREHEGQVIRENQELLVKVKALEEWKARVQTKANEMEIRRVRTLKERGILLQREKDLAAREKAFKKRELELEKRIARGRGPGQEVMPAWHSRKPTSTQQPKTEGGAQSTKSKSEQKACEAFLKYMTKCEEITGMSAKTGAKLRQGVSDKNSLENVCSIMAPHLEEVAKAYETAIEGLQSEVDELKKQVRDGSTDESKTNKSTAALRIREKKAQRETKEALQVLATVGNLCEKVQASILPQAPQELEVMAQIIRATQSRFAPSI
mmetsp:Transcript_22491/g.39856  ORF Transcript_22491/g.39856 Transcript_22491/m.39856 type:complete len:313 (+) Transcript_22491:142-1080(+)